MLHCSLERSQKEDTPPTLAESKLQQRKEPKYSTKQPAPTNADHKPTGQERMKGARNLASIGVAVQIFFGVLYFGFEGLLYSFTEWQFYFLPLSGAIAGAISEMNWRGIVGALVGLVVGEVSGSFFLWWGFLLMPRSFLEIVITLLAPPIGALVGMWMYIGKWKGQT